MGSLDGSDPYARVSKDPGEPRSQEEAPALCNMMHRQQPLHRCFLFDLRFAFAISRVYAWKRFTSTPLPHMVHCANEDANAVRTIP
mmetsp:Transcript_931/g.5854  ORF Transcript_931/g.5854 Transcript_931/m.5854 type:complete len:86 (-) Transcript_931:2404-2661(-)